MADDPDVPKTSKAFVPLGKNLASLEASSLKALTLTSTD